VTISSSAGGTPTGDVTFKLFGPNDPSCSGTRVLAEGDPQQRLGEYVEQLVLSVSSAAADTYRWEVGYPGDATHRPRDERLRHGAVHALDRERLGHR
jgi:hypothetical protein